MPSIAKNGKIAACTVGKGIIATFDGRDWFQDGFRNALRPRQARNTSPTESKDEHGRPHVRLSRFSRGACGFSTAVIRLQAGLSDRCGMAQRFHVGSSDPCRRQRCTSRPGRRTTSPTIGNSWTNGRWRPARKEAHERSSCLVCVRIREDSNQ